DGGTAVDECTVPELQSQESPELVCIVAAAAPVLIEYSLNRLRVQQATFAGSLVSQCVVEQFPQFIVEPVPDRNGEALLRASNDLLWNLPRYCLFQDALGLVPTHLQRGGNCLDKLNELVVEQGHPSFN